MVCSQHGRASNRCNAGYPDCDQEDIASFRATVEHRFNRLEEDNRKHRRNSAGMLVMMRATAGDFDERVNAVEERVAALEAKTS